MTLESPTTPRNDHRRLASILAMAGFLSAGFVSAADIDWTGAIDNDWGIGGNWGGSKPTNLQTGGFTAGATPKNPTLSVNESVAGLEIANDPGGSGNYNIGGGPTLQLSLGISGISWTGGGQTTINTRVEITENQTWNLGLTDVVVSGLVTQNMNNNT